MDIAPNNDDFAQQTSRSKPCPPKLAKLLEMVNIIPPECELPGMNQLQHELYEYAEEVGDYEDVPMEASIRFDKTLDKLPQNFSAWVRQGDETGDWINFFYDALNRYNFFRGSREKLRNIIRLKENPKGIWVFYTSLSGSTEIKIDEQGLITILKDRFAEAVEGIEAARIRKCEACQRIFWAGRIDQRGCSLRCNDILRKRRYRARYKQRVQSAEFTPKEQGKSKKKRKQSTKKGK